MRKIFLSTVLIGSFLLASCASMMRARLDFPDIESVRIWKMNPDKYIEKGPMKLLLTEEEWQIWGKIKRMKNPELRCMEKKRFIDWIWQIRGGAEVEERHYMRWVYADKEFREERGRFGWDSDRGGILIIFGKEDSRSTFTPIFNVFEDTLAVWDEHTEVAQTWIYYSFINLLNNARIGLSGPFEVYFRKGSHNGWELAVKIPYHHTIGKKPGYDEYISFAYTGNSQIDYQIGLYKIRLERARKAVRESYIIDKNSKFFEDN